MGVPSLIDSAFTKSSSGPGPGLVLGTMTRMGHPSQPLSQVLGEAKHWSKGSGHKRWPKAGWSLLGGDMEDNVMFWECLGVCQGWSRGPGVESSRREG